MGLSALEEASLAQAVVHMCKAYLFPRFKFLRGKWYEYDQDKEGGFCKLVMNQLPNLSRCTDAEEIWDRVVVPSIKLKYQTLRNNINSVVWRYVYSTLGTHTCPV